MVRKKSAAPVRLLPFKSDFVFKLVFGEKRRVELMTAFLQAVLNVPPQENEKVTIVDSNIKKEYKDKVGVLGVTIHMKSGTVIDVEIQVRFLHCSNRKTDRTDKRGNKKVMNNLMLVTSKQSQI